MSKIPPELENLMWTLAESDNPQAVSEFEARFPQLKIELAKRTAMVRGLRSNRPDNLTQPAIPRFVPGPPAAQEPTRGMYLISFVFAAVALSVFAYTAVLAHHPKPAEIPVQQETVAPQQAGSQATPFYPAQQQDYAQQWSSPPPSPPRSLRDEPPILDAPAEHAWQRPQSIAMRNVPLQTVLQAVAQEGRLSLDVAPGMPNPTITVDYRDMSAEDILKDLGKIYAFTPILSDDGSAIMVPAVAKSGVPDPTATSTVSRRP